MARLKETTAAAHERAERLLPSLDELATRTGYLRCLGAMHGFYRSWEPAAWSAAGHAVPGLDVSARRKLPALEGDLVALGAGDVMRAAPVASAPAFTSVAESLGALYVFEGATLGGQVILRHVARAAAADAWPKAFFSGYGARTGEMWRTFSEGLVRWTDAHGEEDRIVSGAMRCFTAFGDWLATTGRDTGRRAAAID